MNWVDAVIAGVLVVYAGIGLLRGFVHGLSAIIGLVLTLGGTWLLHRPAAGLLSAKFDPKIAPAISFIGLLAFLYLVVTVLFRLSIRRLPRKTLKSAVNHVLGFLPGVLDGLLMTMLALTILVTSPSERIPRDAIDASRMGPPLLRAGGFVQTKALEVFGPAMRTIIPAQIIEPGEKKGVRLPFTTDHGEEDPAVERRMLEMVNDERQRRGLRRLEWDSRLMRIARAYSRDMLRRGYFSHYSPEGKSVQDRAEGRGLSFPIIGENLALAPTLVIAHEGLMDSPGHRANILHRDYTHIGIGAVVARPHGIMFTQVFARE